MWPRVDAAPHPVAPAEQRVTHMKRELFNRWMAALESGEYPHTRGYLYQSRGSGYCCLGVLGAIQGVQLSLMDRKTTCTIPWGEIGEDPNAGLSSRLRGNCGNQNDKPDAEGFPIDWLKANIPVED